MHGAKSCIMRAMKKSTWLSLGVLFFLSMSPSNVRQSASSPKANYAAQQILVDGVPVVRLTTPRAESRSPSFRR